MATASVSQLDEGTRPPNLESHFSEQLWNLTLRNFDERKREAFRKAREFGKFCNLTLAGVIQRYVDGPGEQVAMDVMVSLAKANFGKIEEVVEIESGDVHTQSFGAGIVLIKVKDQRVKKLLLEKEEIDFYKTVKVEGVSKERQSGKVFLKDIRTPTVRLEISKGEMEHKTKIDAGLIKMYRELMGEDVKVKIEDKQTEFYVNVRGRKKKFLWDKGDRVVTLSNFSSEREGLIVDGPVRVNLGDIGYREMEVKVIGGKRKCKSCGGMGCSFMSCKNRCKYCLLELEEGTDHVEENCRRREIGDSGSRSMAIMRRAVFEENYPVIDLTAGVDGVKEQLKEREGGAWRTKGLNTAMEAAVKVHKISSEKVEQGTPLQITEMKTRKQKKEEEKKKREEEREKKEQEKREEVVKAAEEQAKAEELAKAEEEKARQQRIEESANVVDGSQGVMEETESDEEDKGRFLQDRHNKLVGFGRAITIGKTLKKKKRMTSKGEDEKGMKKLKNETEPGADSVFVSASCPVGNSNTDSHPSIFSIGKGGRVVNDESG